MTVLPWAVAAWLFAIGIYSLTTGYLWNFGG